MQNQKRQPGSRWGWPSKGTVAVIREGVKEKPEAKGILEAEFCCGCNSDHAHFGSA